MFLFDCSPRHIITCVRKSCHESAGDKRFLVNCRRQGVSTYPQFFRHPMFFIQYPKSDHELSIIGLFNYFSFRPEHIDTQSVSELSERQTCSFTHVIMKFSPGNSSWIIRFSFIRYSRSGSTCVVKFSVVIDCISMFHTVTRATEWLIT